ncbi:outer membrane porin GjpA [Mycolicibacterium sp. CBMA 361]|uniref:outer membrane porin GjpA n=1 Tax=Mycolicibacterium sp. CBMA 361 TaxID=2606610 RepID=UPI0013AC8CA5|nr:outer membrane porin GjpA [Mycolicibacterium sp. CBMA 361]MUM32635.1 hypothetical protein [Mycolicibacterium sp. CBMA 361]
MNVAVRRHTKAGICAATTAAIVVSPLLSSAPAITHLPALPAISTANVQLTAAFNPLQPWLDAFNTASANAQQIGAAVSAAPAVLLQQFLANQISHVGAILHNPGSIGSVLQDVGQNVKSAITAATLLGTVPSDWTIAGSNDAWHGLVAGMLPSMLPTAGNPQASAIITQVINVLASPLSGVLIGLVGPGISPVVALVNSLTGIVTSLAKGDAMTAAQTAINIPASMVNGFLNGANLNLDVLAPLLTKTMPAGNSLQNLNFQFGGLFTAGVTGMDLSGIGGSILNSLGLTATTTLAPDVPLEITGQGIGPIGALVNLSHLLAKAIGWSGTGNPLAPPVAKPAAAELTVTKAATDNSITPGHPGHPGEVCRCGDPGHACRDNEV